MLPHFPARCHCHWSVQSSSLYLVLGKEKDFRYMNVIISTIIINIIIQFQDIRHFIFSLNHQQCQTECSILKSCFWSFQRLYIHKFNFSHWDTQPKVKFHFWKLLTAYFIWVSLEFQTTNVFISFLGRRFHTFQDTFVLYLNCTLAVKKTF